MFDTLFSPITINKTVIKNRIVFPSMGLLYSLDMKLNDRYFQFYLERARGGAGIVTVGPVGIGVSSVGLGAPSIETDEAIPSFAKLAAQIKETGARAWVQLYHAGAYVRPVQIGGEAPMAPSGYYCNWSSSQTREMTLEDIKNVQEAFISGAERVKAAGYDGVEIIASAGYLICQFLSPLTNHRTDHYGGSFENRTRFAREIIEQMRERLGPDFPITIRMAGNDFVPGSNTSQETPEFARVYEKAGVDAINVTGGWHESRIPQMTMDVPRGGFVYLAANIKKAVSVPVIASNRIPEPYLAEQFLRQGSADMVNLGRVLLADPFWPAKARAGKPEQIRPCVACLQGCMDELFNIRPVICTVNAETGFEGEREIKTAARSGSVMVIGAGPGGLEAACRAAQAGHQVDLYEKSGAIGGQLLIAGAPPHKQELWELIRYYQAMLELYRVNLHLNTEADLALIKEKKPDYIICAEGAQISVPPIEGSESPGVVSAWEVLKGSAQLGQKIAVIGGGAVGLETAHYIASQGTITPENLYFLFRYEAESIEKLRELLFKGTREVTVFEMMPRVGKGVGKSTRWVLFDNIEKFGIKTITDASILSVEDGIITFEKDGTTQTLAFDTIVNATGSKPVRKIADMLSTAGIPYTVIGDSVRPAQILDAVHEAYLAVMENLQAENAAIRPIVQNL